MNSSGQNSAPGQPRVPLKRAQTAGDPSGVSDSKPPICSWPRKQETLAWPPAHDCVRLCAQTGRASVCRGAACVQTGQSALVRACFHAPVCTWVRRWMSLPLVGQERVVNWISLGFSVREEAQILLSAGTCPDLASGSGRRTSKWKLSFSAPC